MGRDLDDTHLVTLDATHPAPSVGPGMPYPACMALDPLAASEWHDALARRDREARGRVARVVSDGHDDLLERKIEVLTAQVAVLRAAVDVRSRLLNEQAVALSERDERLAALEARLTRRSLTLRLGQILRRGRSGVRFAVRESRRYAGKVRRVVSSGR